MQEVAGSIPAGSTNSPLHAVGPAFGEDARRHSPEGKQFQDVPIV
jgi:hypothetical protein